MANEEEGKDWFRASKRNPFVEEGIKDMKKDK